MSEQLVFTQLLNNMFRQPAYALLHDALKIPGVSRETPIGNTFAIEFLVFLVLISIFLLVRSRLSVENPGGLQHVMESAHEFFSDQGRELIGHGYEAFLPFIATLFFFILLGNLLGLVPGFESPTASPVVPLGLAVVAFIYYNVHGLKKHGPIGYFKHFLGPVWWLAPLMFLIEVVSHTARMMSLTIRLYGNMLAGDVVTMVFFSMIPIGLPVVFLLLHLGVSFLQAYIFALLATIYIGGAVAEEH